MPVSGMPTYAETLSRQDAKQETFMERMAKLRALQNQAAIARMQNAGETQRTGMTNRNSRDIAGMNNANRLALQGQGIQGDLALQGQRIGGQQQSQNSQQQHAIEMLMKQFGLSEESAKEAFRRAVQLSGIEQGQRLETMGVQHGYGQEDMAMQGGINSQLAREQHGYGQQDMQLQGIIGSEQARAAEQARMQQMGQQHEYGLESDASQYEQQLKMLEAQNQYGQDDMMLGAELDQKAGDERFFKETKANVLSDLKNWNGMKEKLGPSAARQLDQVNAIVQGLNEMPDSKASRKGWEQVQRQLATIQPDWKPDPVSKLGVGNYIEGKDGKRELQSYDPEFLKSLFITTPNGNEVFIGPDARSMMQLQSPRETHQIDPLKQQADISKDISAITKELTTVDAETGKTRQPPIEDVMKVYWQRKDMTDSVMSGQRPQPDQAMQQAEQSRGAPFSPQERQIMELKGAWERATQEGNKPMADAIMQRLAPLLQGQQAGPPRMGPPQGQPPAPPQRSPLRGPTSMMGTPPPGGLPPGMEGMPAGLNAPNPHMAQFKQGIEMSVREMMQKAKGDPRNLSPDEIRQYKEWIRVLTELKGQ